MKEVYRAIPITITLCAEPQDDGGVCDGEILEETMLLDDGRTRQDYEKCASCNKQNPRTETYTAPLLLKGLPSANERKPKPVYRIVDIEVEICLEVPEPSTLEESQPPEEPPCAGEVIEVLIGARPTMVCQECGAENPRTKTIVTQSKLQEVTE